MPRRSSGGRPAARAPPRPSPVRNLPQPASHAPPPAPVQGSSGGSMLGGLGATIAQGMAFGTGSAVAHRAVDAVMGPRTIQHETVASEAAAAPAAMSSMGSDACSVHSKAFQDVCFKEKDGLCLTSGIRVRLVLSSSVCGPGGVLECLTSPKLWPLCAIYKCLNTSGSEIGKCQFYMDMLSECRRNSGSMMGA
ncbi:hypothetical protein Acr_10g0009620 [Actinidia rufa]|uniref:CHCH domain-containing protein n=1 Tax=Actinidia rufa TaxID=165716 RepID=A0A7J0FCG2_9ERIC|nr:hypothetical protein Acr_10g0009620 [Actinidia rufa]